MTGLRTDLFARVDKIEGDADKQLTALRVDTVGQIADTRKELASQIAQVRDPVLELLPPVKNILAKASDTSDLMLDCDHNPDCLANRFQGTLKAVEKMAAAGEKTMKVIADTTPETAAAVKSTSKDLSAIVHKFSQPVSVVKSLKVTSWDCS